MTSVLDGPVLYRAALAADVAWSTELKKAFGRNAGDRRYDADQSGHPEAARLAYATFRQTNDAWLTFMRASQADRRPRSADAAAETMAEIKARVDAGTVTVDNARPLSLYVIYANPSDFPGLFVCRRWEIDAGLSGPREVVAVSPELATVRSALPQGLVHLVRDLSDDPTIVESWV